MTTYRIVIIDDQHEVRHMLASALRMLGPNFDVLEVLSAEEGFLLALRGGVDLLVTDVRLPGISGLELVEKIHSRNPELKIILITGVEDSETRQQVAEAPVDAYFYKPLVLDDFLHTAMDCLGVERADQMRVLTTEGQAPGSVEAASPPPDSPEGLTERLYALHTEMSAHAVMILDREGRMLAQSGEYPLLFSEPAMLSSLVAAWNSAERVSLALGMEMPANLLSLGGPDAHLILTHAGSNCMLLVVVPDAQLRDNWVQVVGKAQQDLEHILSAIGMPAAAKDASDAGVLADVKEQPPEGELADVDVLLKQLGQAEVDEDVDAFWEQALEQDEFSGLDSGGALSYDQARKLGLTPKAGEQDKRQDEQPPDLSGEAGR
jgi:DNA-binding NarL/FixJ family response regulator